MANIVSFSSLNRANNGDDDDDARQPQSYYAGGASQRGGGSGLSVIGPDDSGDNVASIIERARQEALRGGNGAGGAPAPGGHVITFYRDGFTVNDGPYRARTDPANRPFLEAIERGCVDRRTVWSTGGEQDAIVALDRHVFGVRSQAIGACALTQALSIAPIYVYWLQRRAA